MVELGLPNFVYDRPGITAGRFKSCYSMLVMLYFLHNLSLVSRLSKLLSRDACVTTSCAISTTAEPRLFGGLYTSRRGRAGELPSVPSLGGVPRAWRVEDPFL